MNINKVTKPVA